MPPQINQIVVNFECVAETLVGAIPRIDTKFLRTSETSNKMRNDMKNSVAKKISGKDIQERAISLRTMEEWNRRDGLFKIELFSYQYDFYLRKKANSKLLFVFLSGFADRKLLTPPVFHRWSWGTEFPGSCLYLSDPSLYRHKDLGLAWYVGDASKDAQYGCIKLIEKIRSTLNIEKKNVVLYGSSGGGFAALRMQLSEPEYASVIINPQTNLFKFSGKAELEKFRASLFKDTPKEDFESKYEEHFDLIRHAPRLRSTRISYVQNLADVHHHKHHFLPFAEKIGLSENSSWETSNVKAFFFDDSLGHSAAEPKDRISEFISHALGTPVLNRLSENQNLVEKEVEQTTKLFVVTPSFNSERTINQTITSVVSQEGNFEIFYHIQDGGSTDNTRAILKEWESRLVSGATPIFCKAVHFSFTTEADQGMYDALDKGLSTFTSASNNDWFSWINADDFFYPGAFSLLQKIDSDQSLSGIISWVTGQAAVNHGGLQASATDRVLSAKLISKGLADGLHWGYVQQEGTFFRKHLWDKAEKSDGFTRLRYAGDWSLWHQFSQYAEIYQFKFPLASFSIREGQLSQVGRKDYELEIERIISKQKRRRTLLDLDAAPILAHYIVPHQGSGKLAIESRSVANHHKYRLGEVAKVPPLAPSPQINISSVASTAQKPPNGGFVVHDKDWQYPAITEHYAYQKLRDTLAPGEDSVYVAFPWATLVDLLNTKKPGSDELKKVLDGFKPLVARKRRVVTVCQHILMLNYQNIFAELGITDVFWTHAVKTQPAFPKHPGIKIHPFPLYPVQAVGHIELDDRPRPVLFSFVGAKSNKWYLTQARTMIVDSMSGDARGVVIGREQWHYNKIVYDHQISGKADPKSELVDSKASQEFKDILLKSTFSLCPSGSGPNSIRLWESLGYGSIPVILADTYLPPGNPVLWEQAAVFCEETEDAIRALPDRLEELAKDPALLKAKRHAMRQLWMLYGPDCFVYDVQKLFLSTPAQPAERTVQWQDASIDAMVTTLLTSNAIKPEAARLLLLGCNSRILANPAQFNARYLNDERLRKAYHIAIGHAPSDLVNQVKRASSLKNVPLFA